MVIISGEDKSGLYQTLWKMSSTLFGKDTPQTQSLVTIFFFLCVSTYSYLSCFLPVLPRSINVGSMTSALTGS